MLPTWMLIIVAWCTAVGSIIGFTSMCFKWLKGQLEKWITTELMIQLEKKLDDQILNLGRKVDKLDGWNKSQQEDIDTLYDEKYIIIKSLNLILNSLEDQDKNGSITEGLESINEYLLKKSAQQRSTREKN